MPRKYTSQEAIVEFWNKVDKSAGKDACWLWLGNTSCIVKWKRNTVNAACISYLLTFGEMPCKRDLHRSCHTPLCVNPKHLYVHHVSLEERFWAHVDKTSDPYGCWLWTGARHPNGYGELSVNGKSAKAHRVAYELTYGEIADGLFVLHQCDNPPCVNPRHLSVGTALDNAVDRDRKGRAADHRGEHNGHAKLTRQQVDEIRQMYANGDMTQRALSRRFGVNDTAIYNIIHYIRWSD